MSSSSRKELIFVLFYICTDVIGITSDVLASAVNGMQDQGTPVQDENDYFQNGTFNNNGDADQLFYGYQPIEKYLPNPKELNPVTPRPRLSKGKARCRQGVHGYRINRCQGGQRQSAPALFQDLVRWIECQPLHQAGRRG